MYLDASQGVDVPSWPSLQFSLQESLWSWKEISGKKKKNLSANMHWPFPRDRSIAVFDAGAEMNRKSESPPGFRLPVSVQLFLQGSWWGKAMGESFEMWRFLHSWLLMTWDVFSSLLLSRTSTTSFLLFLVCWPSLSRTDPLATPPQL